MRIYRICGENWHLAIEIEKFSDEISKVDIFCSIFTYGLIFLFVWQIRSFGSRTSLFEDKITGRLLLLCIWVTRAAPWSCTLLRWNGFGYDRRYRASTNFVLFAGSMAIVVKLLQLLLIEIEADWFFMVSGFQRLWIKAFGAKKELMWEVSGFVRMHFEIRDFVWKIPLLL